MSLCCRLGVLYSKTYPIFKNAWPHTTARFQQPKPRAAQRSRTQGVSNTPPWTGSVRRSFCLLLCNLFLNAVRTALLQVAPPGAAGLMDPGF